MSAIISRMRIPKGLKFRKKVDLGSSMTLPWVQGASHVLSECSDAGPSYSVESVQSCMESEKLIPNPPCVEDILDWEWVNTEFKSDIATQSQKMILSDTPLMSLAPYYCDVVKHSMKEAPLSLAPHQTPINKVRCRWCSALNHATNPNYPDTEPRMRRVKTRTGPSVSGSTVAKTHFSNQNKQMNPLFQKLDRP